MKRLKNVKTWNVVLNKCFGMMFLWMMQLLWSGEFVMVHAAYQSHLGQDCFFAPRAKLADSVIWLLIARAGMTRPNLLQFLLGLSTGTHLACSGVEMIPVKAFRIEPAESTGGHMIVDGEEVDYGPLQAEVFPSLANVMSPWCDRTSTRIQQINRFWGIRHPLFFS